MASASDANVSIIRLTQSIWTELIGLSPRTTPPRKAMNMATMLTVSWNWINFRIEL